MAPAETTHVGAFVANWAPPLTVQLGMLLGDNSRVSVVGLNVKVGSLVSSRFDTTTVGAILKVVLDEAGCSVLPFAFALFVGLVASSS